MRLVMQSLVLHGFRTPHSEGGSKQHMLIRVKKEIRVRGYQTLGWGREPERRELHKELHEFLLTAELHARRKSFMRPGKLGWRLEKQPILYIAEILDF